jgi:hypothetical protein
MIWRVLTRYAELDGRPLRVGPTTAYAMFDGLFQQALLRHLAGSPAALGTLRAEVLALLPQLIADGPAAGR